MLEQIEKITLLWGIHDSKEIFDQLLDIVRVNRISFCLIPMSAPSKLIVYYKDHDFDSYNGEEEIQGFMERLKKTESKKESE